MLLIRNDDTRLTFEKIEWKGKNYYGILKVDGKNKTIPIKKSTIKTICLLDQTASLWGTIGIMIGSLTILGIISSSISFYDSLSGSDIFPRPTIKQVTHDKRPAASAQTVSTLCWSAH